MAGAADKTTEKMTAREAQRIATRERVFKAAVVELKRSGLAQADVRAIVDEAGVAHGTFFFHFPTKEHALAELGQREENRLAGELDRFLSRPRDLAAVLVEVVRLVSSLERRLGTLLFREMLSLYFSPTSPTTDVWADHRFVDRVVGEFERDAATRPPDPEIVASNLGVYFLLGLYGLMITHDRNAARVAVLDQFRAATLRMVAPT